MARPRKKEFSLRQQLEQIRQSGIRPIDSKKVEEGFLTLEERIKSILQIVNSAPVKATEMTYIIMYDISNDKVRVQIAKYLLQQGCMRIQKSVFLIKSSNQHFQEIHDTLKDVNSFYNNEDSIILVPINTSDVRRQKFEVDW